MESFQNELVYLKKKYSRRILLSLAILSSLQLLFLFFAAQDPEGGGFFKCCAFVEAAAFLGYGLQLFVSKKPGIGFWGAVYLLLTIPLGLLVLLPLKTFKSEVAELDYANRYRPESTDEEYLFSGPQPFQYVLLGLAGILVAGVGILNPEFSSLANTGGLTAVMAFMLFNVSKLYVFRSGKIVVFPPSRFAGKHVFHLDEIKGVEEKEGRLFITYLHKGEEKEKITVFAGTKDGLEIIRTFFCDRNIDALVHSYRHLGSAETMIEERGDFET